MQLDPQCNGLHLDEIDNGMKIAGDVQNNVPIDPHNAAEYNVLAGTLSQEVVFRERPPSCTFKKSWTVNTSLSFFTKGVEPKTFVK